MPDTCVMDLPDGRHLAWTEVGDPGGPVVIGFHGTPGSRLQMAGDDKGVLAAGVRLIAPDRPGYGLSSYHRGRTLADWAVDVGRLADHLGVDRFSVIGVSGGGPHAAACASFIPDRLVAAGLVSGVGELGRPGAEKDMLGFNQLMTRMARRAPSLSMLAFAPMVGVGRRWPARAMTSMIRQLPDRDADILRRPEVMQVFVEDMRQASPTAARAAAQDFAVFARDWGFRLEDIKVPVHVWQGDVDRNVPVEHGRLHARRIPGAVLHECPGEGHFLFVDHLEEILRTVTQPQPQPLRG